MNNGWLTGLRIILIASITTGCGGDSETPPPTGGNNRLAELIPLAIGNKWVWESTTFDSAGLVISSRFDSILIVNDTVVADETWYSNQSNIYNINRNDGYWVAIQPETTSSLLYKYPASTLDWYLYGIPSPDEFHVVVMSVSDTVVVPPDTFLCYRYRIYPLGGGDVDTSYRYIEPGTGLAKKDIFDGQGRLKTRQELIRVSLAEANLARKRDVQ